MTFHRLNILPLLLTAEIVTLAFGGELELVLLHLFAGALSLGISYVSHTVQVLIRDLLNTPADAACVIARIKGTYPFWKFKNKNRSLIDHTWIIIKLITNQ